ncbi:MAG: hypothetical protein JSS51_12690 [Planctomycetes bacterium]|nr:hypothetical protein [Planctomycetota bacterium]
MSDARLCVSLTAIAECIYEDGRYFWARVWCCPPGLLSHQGAEAIAYCAAKFPEAPVIDFDHMWTRFGLEGA